MSNYNNNITVYVFKLTIFILKFNVDIPSNYNNFININQYNLKHWKLMLMNLTNHSNQIK